MSKFKLIGRLAATVAIAVCLMLCVLFTGGFVSARAEGETGTETSVGDADGETGGSGSEALLEGFLAQLKAKYGEDYETYYNAIISEWGSVETYLLSLADNAAVPDAVASGWKAFVGWLGEYAPIWGSILAVIAVVIVMVFGKKVLNKVIGWITGMNAKFKTIVTAFNTLYASQKAQNGAITKLLGNNEKYAEERKALEEATEEIEKDEEI